MRLMKPLADAASYWERKRLLYNGVLTILALACWGPDILSGGVRDWVSGGIVLLVFALIANALFCLAYPIDLAFQMSPLRTLLVTTRRVMFIAGLIFASTLALWVMLRSGMA